MGERAGNGFSVANLQFWPQFQCVICSVRNLKHTDGDVLSLAFREAQPSMGIYGERNASTFEAVGKIQ